MRYYIFESGSKGNATLIYSNGRYIAIDNGISHRKYKAYLSDVNISLDEIPVVLITHSHKDHIAGIDIFDRKCLYATNLILEPYDDKHVLVPYTTYKLNGFKVTVIPTSHDCEGSVGFVIEDGEEKLVYITDTGYIYEDVMPYIKDADYYIFESNYDVRMELTSGRPQILINRVMGDKGHLSNEDSALYLSEVISSKTKEITLAHISEEANREDLILKTFHKIMAKRCVDVSNINVRCARQNEMIKGGNLLKEIEV